MLKGVPLDVSGFYFPEMELCLQNMLMQKSYDIVQVELTRMAQYFGKSFYCEKSFLKILVEYDLDFFPLKRRFSCAKNVLEKIFWYGTYRIHRTFSLKMWPLFDHMIVMSEVDRKKVKSLLPDLSTTVVPNGVDLSYFRKVSRKGERKKLLFIGGSLHYPNVDGLGYFFREIFPRLRELMMNEIELIIIGEGWENYREWVYAHDGVHCPGFVDDVRPFAEGQSLMIVPIRIGGGTRLKILEAMAMGIPVVSTPVGCEGLKVEEERELLIANTADEFTKGIMDVFTHENLCNQLIDNGRKFVESNYGWEKLALEMESVYFK